MESPAPAEEWALANAPEVEIGVADGAPEFVFDRVSDAVLLEDGRVVVANCSDPMLRWFRPDGSFSLGSGREGEGPGEFARFECASFRLWAMEGDSISVWEPRARRMQLFGPDGDHARTVPLQPYAAPDGLPYIVGRTGHSGYVMEVREPSDWNSYSADEVWRTTFDYHLFDPDGAHLGPVVEDLPGWALILRIGPGTRSAPLQPFGRRAVATSRGTAFYYSSANEYDISLYSLSGSLDRRIRRSESPIPVTAQIMERVRAYQDSVAADPSAIRPVAGPPSEADYPDAFPTYRELRVDQEGLLWAAEYVVPGDLTASWVVFDGSGRWVARMEVPVGLQVVDLSRDHMLAVATGELGVEYVRVYRIAKGGG